MSNDTAHALPGVAVSARRVRLGRAAAVPLALCFLALSLVFAQPATALSGPSLIGTALEIGESLATSESVVEAGALAGAIATGATAATGVGLLGLTAVAAYQTRDTWLPVVSGLIGGAFSTVTGNGSSGCVLSMGSATIGAAGVSMPLAESGCSGAFLGSQKVLLTNAQWTCAASNGAIATGSNSTVTLGYWGSSTTTSTTSVWQPCGSGSTLTSVLATVNLSTGSTPALAGPSYSVGTAVDPSSVVQTTTIQCSDGLGNVLGTVKATSTGSAGQLEVPSCPAVYPGSVPTHITATAGPTATVQGQTLLDGPLTNPATKYPNCFDSAGHWLTSCVVRVWINGQPCHVGTAGCSTWTTDAADNGDAVECRMGPTYVVPLSDCQELKRAYQTGTGTRTLTVTDPAGTPIDATDPGAGSASSAAPTTGANPSTPADPSTAPAPATSSSSSCFGTGWSWNPVSWVVIPVKCALSWAFVPTSAPSFTDIPSPLPSGWLPTLNSGSDGACGSVSMPPLDIGIHKLTDGPTGMRADGAAQTPTTVLFDTCKAPWPLVRTFTYNGTLCLVLVAVVRAAFRAVMTALGMGVEVAAAAGGDQ